MKDQLIYLSSNILSTESYANVRICKTRTIFDMLTAYKIKQEFF